MKTVILRLEAPMQSWGASSRFEERETLSTPTKSGVVGLVAAALGVPRDDEERLAELGRLEMAVRVDRAGTRGRDYQSLNTAGLFPAGEGAGYAGGILSAAVDGIKVAEAVATSLRRAA